MNGMYRNILVMSFIMVGVIAFYLRNQGVFGPSLLRMLIMYSIQSLALAIGIILVLSHLWRAQTNL
ncbi:TPA: hypothetical protein HA253_00150, partial [Candidatus Woesearchaeota archaeon]|nr:hypothetical protein [Candidatus Woesearchaeota archaeon]